MFRLSNMIFFCKENRLQWFRAEVVMSTFIFEICQECLAVLYNVVLYERSTEYVVSDYPNQMQCISMCPRGIWNIHEYFPMKSYEAKAFPLHEPFIIITNTTTRIQQHEHNNTNTTTQTQQHEHNNTNTTTQTQQHKHNNTNTTTQTQQHEHDVSACVLGPVLW